jgi:hypothetical protein
VELPAVDLEHRAELTPQEVGDRDQPSLRIEDGDVQGERWHVRRPQAVGGQRLGDGAGSVTYVFQGPP